MKRLFVWRRMFTILAALVVFPFAASAQESAQQIDRNPTQSEPRSQQTNVPADVSQAEDAAERVAKRFRLGVEAGVGLDPELLMFGVHGDVDNDKR